MNFDDFIGSETLNKEHKCFSFHKSGMNIDISTASSYCENNQFTFNHYVISNIKKYINKDVFTIVMSYNKKNAIISYLNNNRYYFYTKKSDFSDGRECNALKDLLLARKMNNFFIGAAGSTFSHFIVNSSSFKRAMLIDIININNPVQIINK